MQDKKEVTQISHYFKFGFNAFLDSFNQTILIVVSITFPIAVVAYSIQPEVSTIFKAKIDLFDFLIVKWLFSQAILRLVSTFIFILVILRLELQRKGEEIFWDFSLAFSSLKKVLLVDFTFYFGIQIFISFFLVFFNKFLTLLFGVNLFTTLCTFVLVVFVAISATVCFYFCTFYALLKQSAFKDSFKKAKLLCQNSEMKIFKLFVFFQVLTIICMLFFGIFIGDSVFSKIILHTLWSVLFVPYCYAGYALFFDLEEEKGGIPKG